MTTTIQQEANKENAKLGGVKTEAGKAITRFNALKHGLTSNLLSKFDEDIIFDDLIANLKDELKPIGNIEEILIERIAINFVRMARATKIEKNLIESAVNPSAVVKKYADPEKQKIYELEKKVYDHKIEVLSMDGLEPIIISNAPRPLKPNEPEYELIENKGEEELFNEEILNRLAMVIERYYTTAENRFYRALKELRENRGGNLYQNGFVSQNNPVNQENLF